MKRIILTIVLLIINLGCSIPVRYTPFISLEEIKNMYIGQSSIEIFRNLGSPILIINTSNEGFIWEYQYRFPNTRYSYSKLDKIFKVSPHFGEKPGSWNHSTYSEESDYKVRLHFKDNILRKMVIGDQVIM